MASDVYLYRKDRRWQKFSKIDEIVLTGAQTVYVGVTGVNATDVLTITGNSLSDDDAVSFQSKTGGSSLAVDIIYYVVNKSGNTFQLSSTPGGSALNLGSDITAGVLVQTQADLNVWSGEYRDIFSANISGTGADTSNSASAVASIPGLGSVAAVTTGSFGALGVNVTPTVTNNSDEADHAPLRQSILKRTHWRFRQANNTSPTYLYAAWAEGDQISNAPPETE